MHGKSFAWEKHTVQPTREICFRHLSLGKHLFLLDGDFDLEYKVFDWVKLVRFLHSHLDSVFSVSLKKTSLFQDLFICGEPLLLRAAQLDPEFAQSERSNPRR
jgi:hypothetical protein